jgi:hypothetical protein
LIGHGDRKAISLQPAGDLNRLLVIGEHCLAAITVLNHVRTGFIDGKLAVVNRPVIQSCAPRRIRHETARRRHPFLETRNPQAMLLNDQHVARVRRYPYPAHRH